MPVSKGERDAFRSRIKLLKERKWAGRLLLESVGRSMSDERQEASLPLSRRTVSPPIDKERASHEFVSCWNIELEGLDSKIRVFHSRSGVSRPTSDRDSPFTPMAAEIPASRGATPRLLPRPDHEDNLLLNTPLSSPPDSSIEDSKVPGPSLNREAGDVAPVTLADPAVTDPGLTPDSQTEVGEEAKASGDTLSTQDSTKNFSSNSDRIISSTEDMSTFDSRISSNSLSGEGRGGGEMEKEMSDAVAPAKLTTVAVAQANKTKTGPKCGEKSVGVARGGSDTS
ncbi:hypothetical protein GBAR_LOCUS22675 [Geodia barretti]|uniref:Uncharacterized protein n=1 Tax=Geodia barretti TaxID=519541 RepID=A0AA35T2W4_GEOBA|nr:hypothetical protein GBAR_LOCUS22675 [Geodia barretti]